MKEKENTNILSSTTNIFTLSLIIMVIFNLLFRKDAAEISKYSELFAFCDQGLSFKALAELLVTAFFISLVRYFWFSDRFFKDIMMFHRVTFLLISVLVLATIASILFNWFPIHMWEAWTGFIVSFALSTAVSFGLMLIRSKVESKKYQNMFDEYKKRRAIK